MSSVFEARNGGFVREAMGGSLPLVGLLVAHLLVHANMRDVLCGSLHFYLIVARSGTLQQLRSRLRKTILQATFHPAVHA